MNGTKNQVNQNKVFVINRDSQLAISITEKESAPALLFFDSQLPDLVQHSLNYGDEVLLENGFLLKAYAQFGEIGIIVLYCRVTW